MFGIDWPIWAAIAVGAAWKLLRRYKPRWAKKLRVIEPLARAAFEQAETLGALFGWTGAMKLTYYKELVLARAKANGVPISTAELDLAERRFEGWAEGWARGARALRVARLRKDLPKGI